MSPLGIGFIGSGFNARFHMQGMRFVRDCEVLGVWSPNAKNAASAAKYADGIAKYGESRVRSIVDAGPEEWILKYRDPEASEPRMPTPPSIALPA